MKRGREEGRTKEEGLAQEQEKDKGLVPSSDVFGRGKGGKGLGKRLRLVPVTETEEGEDKKEKEVAGPPYINSFTWSGLARIGGGGRIKHLTNQGGSDYCDERVDDELVEEGQQLLRNRFDQVVKWYEDDDESKQRRAQIEAGFVASWPKCEAQRVIRAPGNTVRVFYSSMPPQEARYEITYLAFDDMTMQYGFLVDRGTDEFVFAGVVGCHPHCGTADFSYDNSDGSGPCLFEEEEEEEQEEEEGEEKKEKEGKEAQTEASDREKAAADESTQFVAKLIAAVKLRLSEFCRNMYH